MQTRWRLHSQFRTIDVVRRGEPDAAPAAGTSRQLLGLDLERLLGDSFGQRVVLEMFRSVYGDSPTMVLHRKNLHDLRRHVVPRLLEAFARGDLFELRGGHAPLGATSSSSEAEEEPPVEPTTTPTREVTWIEIELVDADDNPVGFQQYLITLPDGSERRGTLNAQGFARVDGIDPGNCDITFPTIDGREWEAA